MSLTLTPLVTDNFTPNANPLNPAHWTQWTGVQTTSSLRATGGQARAQSADAGLFDGNYYSGAVFPDDQYVTGTLARWIKGDGQEADIFLRSDTTGEANFYDLIIFDNQDGVTGTIEIIDGPQTVIYENDSVVISAGDVITMAVVGNQIYLYQNGTLVTPALTATGTASSGVVGLFLSFSSSSTECAWSNFIAGSAAQAGPTPAPGGPATVGTVFPGPYYGSSLATAFPNAQGLDFFQVINEGGKIVWNLNKSGVATTNPTNPTAGTLLGQFEGSSFATAFPNPYKLNVFQIIGKGGGVVFHVDYQGNAVTP